MLAPSIPRFRRRRGQALPKAKPAPLTLVAAAFDDVEPPRLWLTFDRTVDVAGLVGGEIRVDDGLLTGFSYRAAAAAVPADPRTAQVELVQAGTWGIDETRLTAGPGTRIVAADDGGAWAGVTDLLLPFP